MGLSRARECGDLAVGVERSDEQVPLNPAVEEYRIGIDPANMAFVGVFDGRLANKRLAAQEGLFLVPSRIDLDFERWLAEIATDENLNPYHVHWVKYVFANQDRRQYYRIATQLMQMGMSPIRLFPGLVGICESFRFSWLEVVKDLEPPFEAMNS